MDNNDIVSTLKYATVGSSFLFLTNSYHLYLKRDNLYSLAFFALFLSSVQFHYSQNEIYEAIDKLVVYIVVFLGGTRLFYNWQHSLLHYFVVVTFLGTVIYILDWGILRILVLGIQIDIFPIHGT